MANVSASLAPEIPQNWTKGDVIGRGSYGTVYHVIDPNRPDDKRFIVKEIQVTSAKKDKQSNITELEILKRLNNKRIVPFYGSCEMQDSLLIFMGYMKMGSLFDYIQKKNVLTEDKIRIFTRQILEGAAYLHSRQTPIIHRDIKGQNVLLEDESNIKLTDFGLSKILHEQTNARSSLGTYKWMAPEVISVTEGQTYDTKADIWSIGCTVVEMATGQPPFPNLTPFQVLLKVGNGGLPEYNLPEKSSEALKLFLKKTFQKDATSRPTAHELLKVDFVTESCLSPEVPLNREKAKKIGVGSFGLVFLVLNLDKPQDKLFAVKEISIESKKREQIMSLFREEANILRHIHHDRIVPFYGYSESENVLSLYMAYMKLGSLEDYISSKGRLLEEKAKLFAVQILGGVQHLHDNGIIHSDITGKHVLLDNENSAQLGGISVSKTFRKQPQTKAILTQDSETGCVGSVNWMAPEMIKGIMEDGKFDNKVDIWSVGCTVVQMVTGSPPFSDLEHQQVIFQLITSEKPPAYKLPESSSHAIKDFLKKTFERAPEQRPSAAELLSQDPFLSGMRNIGALSTYLST
ncbi:unnamed protein product [Lymnaea stagnalis]|uniref:Protein kinase domain-containing protein n=1 Tax=Lymnaea stagnalis TaxID=6523 RepID=A0AAV2HYF6_LYMST